MEHTGESLLNDLARRRAEGKKNVYTCPHGHQTVTVDIDDGTTPMMLKCRHKEGCNEFARSGFYQVDQSLTPTYEWFKPTPKQVKKMSAAMKQHIQMGGLELRKI